MKNLIRVQTFILEYWGIKDINKLSIDKFLSDLGFYGDDKLEFIQEFFREFEINAISFDANKFIESESNFLSPMNLFNKIFKKNKSNTYKSEITIRDLVLSIEEKIWIK